MATPVQKSLQECTVKVSVKGIIRSDPRVIVYENLKEIISTDFWKSFGKLQQSNQFMVTFTSKGQVDALVKQRLLEVNEETSLLFESVTESTLNIRVHWLPPYISDAAVKQRLQYYGDVLTIDREIHYEFKGLNNCETGVREIKLRLSETDKMNIPHLLKIEGYSTLITFRGRPPLCLRCNAVGHTRGQCPQRKEQRVWTKQSDIANGGEIVARGIQKDQLENEVSGSESEEITLVEMTVSTENTEICENSGNTEMDKIAQTVQPTEPTEIANLDKSKPQTTLLNNFPIKPIKGTGLQSPAKSGAKTHPDYKQTQNDKKITKQAKNRMQPYNPKQEFKKMKASKSVTDLQSLLSTSKKPG